MTTGDEEAGERILAVATDAAREVLGARLSAVFALGSLAHGGFAPLASDIDLAVILDDLPDDVAGQIAEVRRIATERADDPLAERLSVFWSDWDGVRGGASGRSRLAEVDRLDLLEDGRLLYGADQRASAVRPDKTTVLVETARFAVVKFDDAYLASLRRPADLLAAGPRAASKAALFPIRLLYTLQAGRVGQNDAAVAWYEQHGEHPALARAAIGWRQDGIADQAAAVAVLKEHLIGVYDELLASYSPVAAANGHADLAASLEAMRATLRS
jgi:predicted nucleotidyltransferase